MQLVHDPINNHHLISRRCMVTNTKNPEWERRWPPFSNFEILLKVTVQFETEGNDQNEIVSHID